MGWPVYWLSQIAFPWCFLPSSSNPFYIYSGDQIVIIPSKMLGLCFWHDESVEMYLHNEEARGPGRRGRAPGQVRRFGAGGCEWDTPNTHTRTHTQTPAPAATSTHYQLLTTTSTTPVLNRSTTITRPHLYLNTLFVWSLISQPLITESPLKPPPVPLNITINNP